MTKRQESAVKRLEKALEACHKAGLRGGVYEYRMRIWPSDISPQPHDCGYKFFERVEEVGFTVMSNMVLDGGSGW